MNQNYLAPIDFLTSLTATDQRWWVGEFAVTSGPRILRAANDLEAVRIFLSARANNRNTLSSYVKETNRLLMWCHLVQQKPLSSLDYNDIISFNAWLANPGHEFITQDRQLAGQGRALFYRKGLSVASAKASMRVIAALFNELEMGGYLAANPVRLFMRHQKGRGSAPAPRREPLPGEMLTAIEEWLESLPGLTTERADYGALVAALGYMGLRASEAARNTLGGFHFEESEGVRIYAYTVTGKGNKSRVVPVEKLTQAAFERYRFCRGLPAALESAEGATLPLLGQKTRSGVYRRVRMMRAKVAAYLTTIQDPRAEWFDSANIFPHRMRHTATRRWLDCGVSLEDTQDSLGHSSIDTTRIYDNRPTVKRLKDMVEKVESKS